MRTLADITPLELANCVGTWVDVPHKPHPVIYMGEFESTGEIKHGAVILDPRYGTNHTRLDNCTPRPDLPRAWNPDGVPVAGEYEYAVQVRLQENGQWHQVTEWSTNPNPYKPGHEPNHNERIVRRLVSQPEEVQP